MQVIVSDANLSPHRARFEAALPAETDVRWRIGTDSGALLEELRDAEVYVGGRFTADMARSAERLRLVHVVGAGTDRVDFAALSQETLVANTFHHERSIAEYVLAAVILCAWELLSALGCAGAAVTGSGRVDATAHGLSWAGDTGRLRDLMRESDVVVVSAPLTPETEGMIGAAELAALGPDGALVNVGRGPLVDESALYEALRDRAIRGAALDVWYRYPAGRGERATPSDLPFGDLPNVFMTPHASGVTADTFIGRCDDIAANIVRLARGEPLRNVVRR